MKKKLGFILNSTKDYVVIIIPINFVHFKYKKIQIKIKKYYILNYRHEYKKGDIVLYDSVTNKIYAFYK